MTTTTTIKITKRDRFNQLLSLDEVKANGDLVDFINHELELLDKKSAKKKSSKDNDANKALMANIVDVLRGHDKMTITEILMTGVQDGHFDTTVSTQKIRTLVGYLIDDRRVVREVEKNKPYFTLAEGV